MYVLFWLYWAADSCDCMYVYEYKYKFWLNDDAVYESSKYVGQMLCIITVTESFSQNVL